MGELYTKRGRKKKKLWTCSEVHNDDDVEIDQPYPWVGQGDPEPEMPGRLKILNWGFIYTFCCENKDEVAAAMNFDSAEFDTFEGMRYIVIICFLPFVHRLRNMSTSIAAT